MKGHRRLTQALRLRPLPRGFLWGSLLLVVLFVIVHAAGLRAHTTVLCGGLPVGGTSYSTSLFKGLLYIFAYASVVLVVPILLLAAVVQVALRSLLAALSPGHEKDLPPPSQ